MEDDTVERDVAELRDYIKRAEESKRRHAKMIRGEMKKLPTHCATCGEEMRVRRAVSGYTTCGDDCERALAVAKRLKVASK